MDTVYSEP